MPGSPPKSVKDPGTNPPPKTLLSSLFFVFNLASDAVEISFILSDLETLLEEDSETFQLTFSAFWITSSAMVFHSLQAEHYPCHLEKELPQF